ncbi:MAG: outer membrane protein transport protein, partial [candidate division Zixibacteria bacterium]|nr:outer membrane protein transport protein [candidate division Zixibacteria bacterium]
MTRIFAYIALLVMLLTCSATTILAQGNAISEVSAGNFFGVGGRAVGMSEAVVVSSLDGTAIVYNPAALVRIMRPEFYAGLSNEKVSNSSSYGSSVARNDFSKTRLSSLNLAVPVPTYRGSFVVAFGVNRTMSFDRTYTFLYPGLNGSEKALEEGNGGIREWSAAAAVELSPRVSVGATLTYFHGSEDYYWDYSSFVFNDTGGDPPSYSLRNVDNIKSRYSAIGARLGMIVEANPYLSFGFMVESPKRFNVKQDYIQRTVLNGNLDVTPGSYEYVLQHPYSTMLAV